MCPFKGSSELPTDLQAAVLWSWWWQSTMQIWKYVRYRVQQVRPTLRLPLRSGKVKNQFPNKFYNTGLMLCLTKLLNVHIVRALAHYTTTSPTPAPVFMDLRWWWRTSRKGPSLWPTLTVPYPPELLWLWGERDQQASRIHQPHTHTQPITHGGGGLQPHPHPLPHGGGGYILQPLKHLLQLPHHTPPRDTCTPPLLLSVNYLCSSPYSVSFPHNCLNTFSMRLRKKSYFQLYLVTFFI